MPGIKDNLKNIYFLMQYKNFLEACDRVNCCRVFSFRKTTKENTLTFEITELN